MIDQRSMKGSKMARSKQKGTLKKQLLKASSDHADIGATDQWTVFHVTEHMVGLRNVGADVLSVQASLAEFLAESLCDAEVGTGLDLS